MPRASGFQAVGAKISGKGSRAAAIPSLWARATGRSPGLGRRLSHDDCGRDIRDLADIDGGAAAASSQAFWRSARQA